MLMRSPLDWLATTSWRSQLSNSKAPPATAGNTIQLRLRGAARRLSRRRTHVAIESRILELQSG